MDSDCSKTEPALSEDQRAVIEYFASAAYQRRRPLKVTGPFGSLLLDALVPNDRQSFAAASFWMGLAGLNAILLLFAVLTPIVMHALEPVFVRQSGYIITMILIQSMFLPPIISFSFATVTPMFWYGSVFTRFVAGTLMVVPGCLAFVVAISWLEGIQRSDDFFVGFCGVMFAQFLSAGAVALTVQMWSPWTLSHARSVDAPLPPLGTRAMMELTGVAAIGYAVFVAVDTDDIVEGLLFFAAVGSLTSLAVIGMLIAFLRGEYRSHMSAVVSLMCAVATALLLNGFFAVNEFGWDSIQYNFVIVTALSLYGALVIQAVIWLCLWWLRVWGWRCVSRKEDKRRKAMAVRLEEMNVAIPDRGTSD